MPEPAPHPFFIERPDCRLFAIHHPRPGDDAGAAGVIFLPPFAEEMNRSRRMAAPLARAVSASRGPINEIGEQIHHGSSGRTYDRKR